eukprot:6214452-Pleurochrysis_carterae.AAC.1
MAHYLTAWQHARVARARAIAVWHRAVDSKLTRGNMGGNGQKEISKRHTSSHLIITWRYILRELDDRAFETRWRQKCVVGPEARTRRHGAVS